MWLHAVACLFFTFAGGVAGAVLGGFPVDRWQLVLHAVQYSLASFLDALWSQSDLTRSAYSAMTFNTSEAQAVLASLPEFNEAWIVVCALLATVAYTLFAWYAVAWVKESNSQVKGIKPEKGKGKRKSLFKRAEIYFGVYMPIELECVHTLAVGATGSGKTQIVRAPLLKALERGQMGLCADYDCEHTLSLAREGDTIIAPFSDKYSNYSILSEMKCREDATRIANIIITLPDSGPALEWAEYAQTLAAGLLELGWDLNEAGIPFTNRDFCVLLNSGDPALLRQVFEEESPAISFLREGNEKLVGNVLAIAASKGKALSAFDPEAGFDSFSIRDWVLENGDKKNAAFLWVMFPYDFRFIGFAISSIICGMYVDSCMALEKNDYNTPVENHRRCWLIVDEIGQYPAISGLKEALSVGRKKGISAVLATQTVTQLIAAYGKYGSSTLFSNLTSRFYFRSNDNESAEYCQREVGQRRFVRTTKNTSRSEGESTSNSVSNNNQVVTEDSVLASSFKELPDLTAWCKVGAAEWQSIDNVPFLSIPPAKIPKYKIRVRSPRTGMNTTDKVLLYLGSLTEVADESRADFFNEIEIRHADSK